MHKLMLCIAAALLMLLSLARFVSASDLREYGATCDGRDDTAAFQAAVAEARVKPQPIKLPAGVCGLRADALVIDAPGITIRGQGIGATAIRLLTNGDGIRFGASAPGSSFGSCGGLENLAVESEDPDRTLGRTVVVTGCWGGRISNVKITAAGHALSFVCPAGSGFNCSRWRISDVFIENRGASAGVWIEGGNDRLFSRIHVRGRREPGSRGFLFLESGGADDCSQCDVILQEVGWAFVPPAGREVRFIECHDCYGDSALAYGWNFAGSGTIRFFDCVACWAGGNGSPVVATDPELPPGYGASARGFRIVNGDGLSFTNLRARDNYGPGLEMGPDARNLQLIGGWAAGNGAAASGAYPGVRLAGSGAQVIGLRSGDYGYPVITQSCGVEFMPSATSVTVLGGDFRGNAVGETCTPTAVR